MNKVNLKVLRDKLAFEKRRAMHRASAPKKFLREVNRLYEENYFNKVY